MPWLKTTSIEMVCFNIFYSVDFLSSNFLESIYADYVYHVYPGHGNEKITQIEIELNIPTD